MISKLASEVLDKILNEIKKKENMTKIHKNLIDPLIYYSFKRVSPYIFILFTIFILTFILAVLILILLIKDLYKN